MGDATRAHDGDSFGEGVCGSAKGLAEGPGPMERRQRRALTVDVGRDDREVVSRGEEVERDHDPVVEQPLLRVGDVATFHHQRDEPFRQRLVAGHRHLVDAEPTRILDRPAVRIRHADCERRHVVHEEVREVLGGDHDERVGFRCFERQTHPVERGVEAVAQRRVGPVGPTGDARSVAAHPREDERHQRSPGWLRGVDTVVPGHRVDPFADRAVGGDAVAHPLEVVGPLDLVERSEVHQDLAVHAEVEQQADVGLDERSGLLVGEFVRSELVVCGRPGTPVAAVRCG